jgi:hypothetical protein
VEKNTIDVPGESLAPRFTLWYGIFFHEPILIDVFYHLFLIFFFCQWCSSSEYLGRMVAALLTEYPLSTFAGKRIYLREFDPSLEEIASALEERHGRKPDIKFTSVESLEGTLQTTTHPEEKFMPAVRLRWARGGAKAADNIFEHELKGYQRKTLANYIYKNTVA